MIREDAYIKLRNLVRAEREHCPGSHRTWGPK